MHGNPRSTNFFGEVFVTQSALLTSLDLVGICFSSNRFSTVPFLYIFQRAQNLHSALTFRLLNLVAIALMLRDKAKVLVRGSEIHLTVLLSATARK